MKKIICLLFTLAICAIAFSLDFTIQHLIESNSDYSIKFWEPGKTTPWVNNSVSLTESVINNKEVARIGVYYNGSFSISKIEVEYGQMKNGNNVVSPYILSFNSPGTTTPLSSSVCEINNVIGDLGTDEQDNPISSGAGEVTLFKNGKTFSAPTTVTPPFTDEIASMNLTLDLSDSPAGDYTLNITLKVYSV